MNIFVARLDYSTTSDVLNDTFQQFGEVSSAKVVLDRETGRSKGFGFVEMPNDEEAQNAINDLNDTDLDGRKIVVKKAEERPPRSGGFRRDNRYGGGGGGRRY